MARDVHVVVVSLYTEASPQSVRPSSILKPGSVRTAVALAASLTAPSGRRRPCSPAHPPLPASRGSSQTAVRLCGQIGRGHPPGACAPGVVHGPDGTYPGILRGGNVQVAQEHRRAHVHCAGARTPAQPVMHTCKTTSNRWQHAYFEQSEMFARAEGDWWRRTMCTKHRVRR